MKLPGAGTRLRTALLVGALAMSGCGLGATPSSPVATLGPDVAIDCGPISDPALCQKAVDAAAAAKINPPPIVDVRIRDPRPDDDCIAWRHACGPGTVIVTIQSGDTIQDVPLALSDGAWLRLDSMR